LLGPQHQDGEPRCRKPPVRFESPLEWKGWGVQPRLQEAPALGRMQVLRDRSCCPGHGTAAARANPGRQACSVGWSHQPQEYTGHSWNSATQVTDSFSGNICRYIFSFTSLLTCGRSLFKSCKYCCTTLLATVDFSSPAPVAQLRICNRH